MSICGFKLLFARLEVLSGGGKKKKETKLAGAWKTSLTAI